MGIIIFMEHNLTWILKKNIQFPTVFLFHIIKRFYLILWITVLSQSNGGCGSIYLCKSFALRELSLWIANFVLHCYLRCFDK